MPAAAQIITLDSMAGACARPHQNTLPPPHCTPEEWATIIRGWRDRKHGLSPNAEISHDRERKI